MKKTFYIAIALLLIVVITAVIRWNIFKQQSIVVKPGLTYVFNPGATVNDLVDYLHTKGQLGSPALFRLLLHFRKANHRLQAGEYFFPAGSTPVQVINKMLLGQVVRHKFIIVDGLNIYQIMQQLNTNPYLKHTLKNKSLSEIAKEMGAKHSSPEGLLLPDTYYFRYGATDLSILQRAYTEMKEFLDKQWPTREKELPYTSQYQALIVASMVEKETAMTREMPIIAAVILKRWKIWMPLQIDSTVIYGLEPHFSGTLTAGDLRKKSPYNTYMKYGLPPTPIAMPGKRAIEAALHPAKTNYLYFVAKGDGSHKFSETLAEQRAAIQKYLIDPQQQQAK